MLSPVPSDPPPLSPGRSSCGSDTGAVLIRSTRQMAAEAPQHVQITVRKLREPQQSRRKHGTNPEEGDPERAAGDPPPGPELQTSCYQPGGRGVVLGALRQRCVGTKKREVSVQLLEPRRTLNPPFHQSAEDAAGVQGGASSGLEDVSRTAVAAAAAAVAAAAPLFKAQSDIEAQMSRLSESVQKLLETNREADGWRWGLSQQTLHHLETLQSQQLQLQSQLMESAIKIVTGHGSMTSDSKAAAKIRYQKPGRPASTAAITQMDAVTMETGPRGSRPGQTRDNLCVQAPLAECLHLQSLANDTQEAVRRASDMLKQMESLKTEIKMLLTQQEQTPQFSFPAPVQSEIPNKHLEPQQSKSKPKQAWFYLSSAEQSQSRPNDLQQNVSQNTSHIQHNKQHEKLGQQLQSQLNPPSSRDLQPVPTPSQAGPSLTHPSFTQESRGLSNQRSHPGLVQRKPGSHSVLEEAGQVLRQARRRKKVLEENLEALMKAKNGEILHCQLEALAANRDLTEDVRIKKTVDAWISSLTRDTQVQDQPPPHQGETRPGEANQHRAANAAKFRPRPSGRGKTPTVPRGTSNRPVMGRGSRGQPAGHRTLQEAEPNGVSGNLMGIQQEDVGGELYLTRLYGKLPHEGLRRTLKRSPYPRFSSPASPLGRKHRPRLVESIRGVRVKSCKTQTSFSPLHSLSLEPPVDYTGSSTGATAIPLRPPRIHSSSRREHHQEAPPRIHSSFMSGHGQEVLPSALPASGAERNDSTDYQQKQQPITEKPSSSPLCIIKTAAAEPHEDHEENFPGNNFLSVSDLNQEENSEVGEEAVVLEGRLSPSPVRYHSPAFPPRAPSPGRVEKGAPAVTGGPRRDVLEDRLVEWVEQQLMSRMIADMYPRPPPDPAQNDSTDQSELEEQSLTSDIVKAAGGGGLQLFVDSNMSVDSALIRQLVNEVLSETVAQMLNGTDVAPEPEVEAAESQRNEETEQPAPLVPTPVPTPPPSGPQPSRESPPAATPPPSTPSSPVILESAEPVPTADPVATPTATPEPRSPEESPPASLQAPPPKLPLDEDGPEEELESQKQPLVASMEEEEPPACRPATAQSEAEPSPALPPSLSETSSSSSSSSSSSVTAETEAALKHISEGELLISANQLAPLTEEEGLCSFSSSLREVEDMTLDSSTVEQVGGRDLLLTLLTKVDQGGQRPDPEGSWGREEMEDEVSLGEVRDYGHLRPQNRTRTVGLLDQTSACGQNSPPAEDEQQEKLNTGGAMKGGVHPSTFRPQEDRDQEEMRSTESSSDDVF